MADQNYYPALSTLISFENLPVDFDFKSDFSKKNFIKNLQLQRIYNSFSK